MIGPRLLLATLLGLGLGLGAGCAAEPEPDRLWITGIHVLDESEPSLLDIEVHLFDAASRHLGCAILEPVDASGTSYEVEAYFALGAHRIEPRHLAGRNVVISVIEDDLEPCPAQPDIAAGDDPVGTSAPLPGDELGLTGPLQFGNVARLELALYP